MAKVYDNSIFSNNFDLLLETHKEIKIGDLEKEIGVSKGYFARMKSDASANPGIDVVLQVANRFGVSIDSLIGVDMSKMNVTESYLYEFYRKLLVDTEAGKLEWGRETAESLNSMRVQNGNYVPHPFFYPALDIVRAMNGKAPKDCFFNSDTFKSQTKINGDCYFLRMNDGALLFLADVAKKYQKAKDSENCAKEIWMRKNDALRFLSSNKNENFITIINNLFSAIDKYCLHPRIENDYRSSIDAYMRNENNDNTATTADVLFPEERYSK